MQTNSGRPRDKEVDYKILEATKKVLSEFGLQKMTIEAVAKIAVVGKTSIYRRYKNKNELILAALSDVKSTDLSNLDMSKSALDITLEVANRFIKSYNNSVGRQMISMTVNTMIADDELSEEYWKTHAIPELSDITELMVQFQQWKKISRKLDPEVCAETLVSIFMAQFLLRPRNQVQDALIPLLKQLFETWQ